MAVQPEPRRNGMQLLGRAADVLRALATNPDGLTLTELSLAVGLPKSTVHRLVGGLEAEDFVGASEGRIRLGRGIARLGAATRSGLRRRLHAQLLSLAQEVDETVDLSILEGASIRFIDQIPSSRRLRAVSAIGSVFPVHCTAPGKAMLATMPSDQVDAVLPQRLESLTPATITTRRALRAELELASSTGIGFDREEHTEGICAVGAVVRDPYGIAAAISIPVPTQRFAGREEELAERLLETCAKASAALGA